MTELDLRTRWSDCVQCKLCEHRTQVVLGWGNPNADIMVISDKPGFQEDQDGIPMIGPAGLFYQETLTRLGLRMEDVWTTNAVACMPPDNRDPFVPELEACKERLYQEIRMVDPFMLVLMGRVVTDLLTNANTSISKIQLRTYLVPIPGILTTLWYPAIVTYNPGYVRKNPSQGRGQPWHYMYRALKKAVDVSKLLREAYGRHVSPE